MYKEVLEFKQKKKEFEDLLRIYVVSPKVPLKDRWQVFVNSDLGTVQDYYEDFTNLDDALYAEREFNRREVFDIVEFIESFDLKHKDFDDKFLRSDKEGDSKEVMLNSLKEEVLRKFIKSFIFDW